VAQGEVVTLLGRNSMGKTTTINSIMGIVRPQAGSIQFDGHEVMRLPSFRTAKLGVGLVPEGRQVFPNLTVLENLVATAADRHGAPEPWTIERIFELFPELAARRSSMGNLLSGGEQQMLAVGRALMTNPRLLLLDEATEGLAPLIRQKIWAALARIRTSGVSILVVDKNVADLIRVADRHYIIEKGRVVWQGTSPELAAQQDIQHRYLGV
jgi:branched-chain amino acid transport system ATP-binding protein